MKTANFFRIAAVALFAMASSACATYGNDGPDDEMANADMNDGMSNDMDDRATTAASGQMDPARNIVENAANAPDFTTLVAAVQAAGLADTLAGSGPFTIFAPTNAAFDNLPAGTVDTLLQPENREQLQGILTYHAVPGTITAANLVAMIQQGEPARLTTVGGKTLTARMMGSDVVIVDEKGGTATVTQTDLMQSNGVIHVINSVLMPN